jgi:hypothetical protein
MDSQNGFTLDVELSDARELWSHRNLLSNGPHKGAQLSIAFTEPPLRLPTNILDGFGQPVQTQLQVRTDFRWIPIGPGAFDEGAARVGIPGFGARSLAAMVSRGIC